MIIHRPKLRWSPKLAHHHASAYPSIRDRLRRWREAVNAVTLRDDNRPKLKRWCSGGGGCNRTRSGTSVNASQASNRNGCGQFLQVWTQHERVERDRNGTGTGPERDRNGTGTGPGPERDRNGTGTGTGPERDRNRNGTGTGTGPEREPEREPEQVWTRPKSGGVHDSYTLQCGLVGSFTSPGIDTR